jgi:Photosynthesis system II assembly factor YCF48/Secretion system C-terminal sorting domain
MKKLLLITLFTQLTLYSQWVQQTLPVNKPITGIKFVDSLKGWACTSYGSQQDSAFILYTTNSGTNWLVQLRVYNSSFYDLDMINTLTGYVAGHDYTIARGKLFSTTNGGLNWSSVNLVPNMDIGDMQFINQDSGWECGVSIGPDVRTTTDGGNTWTVRTSGLTGQTDRIFFLNYNTGFCALSSVFGIYKTTNAGVNWVPNGTFSQFVQSIFFLNINTGWVGVNVNRMYHTSNGGTNWIMQTMPNQGNNNVYDLYFFNDQTGFAGTGLNRIFKTTNGGTNWGYQIDTGGSYRLSFINDLTGWSCWIGNIGITHTTNGGGPIIYTGFVSNSTSIPDKFILYQNYPNPFNPSTTIELDLPVSSKINLIICDILGRELYKIADEHLKPGSYTFTWDARKCASGIYFYRLTTDDHSETKKMILIK